MEKGRYLWNVSVSSALMILFGILLFPPLHLNAEEIPYRTGIWEADSLGNHRVVIKVAREADAVWIHIPWRRRDFNPEEKNIILIDAETGARVKNLCRVNINREFGDLVFQPATVPGVYHIYHLPYIMSGSRNYPTFTYPKPEKTVEMNWLERHGLMPDKLAELKRNAFPQAEVVEIQAIDEFNSFYPMEVIATAEETRQVLDSHPESDYLLFPEDRKYPVRMTDDLPLR